MTLPLVWKVRVYGDVCADPGCCIVYGTVFVRAATEKKARKKAAALAGVKIAQCSADEVVFDCPEWD